MSNRLLSLVAVLALAVMLSPSAYSKGAKHKGSGPSWMGDADTTLLFNTDAGQTATSPNNIQARYAYHLGVWGDYDWLDYMVELGSNASASDPHTVFGMGPAVPGLALSRAKMTVHVMDTLFLDFGRFDNPLAVEGWNFFWDPDYKTTGWGQRVEVGNFFLNVVEHLHTTSIGSATVALGSNFGGGATILFGGNMGYTWEWTDSLTALTTLNVFDVNSNTQVGANVSLNWENKEGYPVMLGVGGYLPVGTKGAGTTLAGLLRLQYGDLSVDDSYMLAWSLAYIGDDSFIQSSGPVAGADFPSVWANERLTRVSGALLTGGALTSTVIDVGIDAFYRFHSWFELGLLLDYGTSSKTTLADTSFIYAELVARTKF